jgi:hypothetical protein
MKLKKMKTLKIAVQLSGVRPLMFDRYAGDNNTQLAARDKMYLDQDGCLTIPAINVYSLLHNENGMSVTKQFFGKQRKNVGLGIMSYTSIDQMEIPLLDDNGPIFFDDWNDQIYVMKHVARLAKGVPNPKERPVLATPWRVEFEMEYQENKLCTLNNLQQIFQYGGSMGLGTFRPQFGRYELTRFDY